MATRSWSRSARWTAARWSGTRSSELRGHLPATVDARVAAIFRRGKPVRPEGNTVIEADDEVFFLADRRDIRTVMSELRKLDKPARRVFLAGGGNIGKALAKSMENSYSVKVLERSRERSKLHRRGPAELDRAGRRLPPTRTCCARRTSTRPTSTAR